MAYNLHIERMGASSDSDLIPISLEEWQTAISITDGVRLFTGQAHTIANPKTGELISFPKSDGDAEIFFPAEKRWHLVFRWFEGSVTFGANFQPRDKFHPVWIAAVALAKHLAAIIRGDDGEIYNLETGKIVQ